MENKRLLRTVRKFKDSSQFVDHVILFLKYYNIPWNWTKLNLYQYWSENHEFSK